MKVLVWMNALLKERKGVRSKLAASQRNCLGSCPAHLSHKQSGDKRECLGSSLLLRHRCSGEQGGRITEAQCDKMEGEV